MSKKKKAKLIYWLICAVLIIAVSYAFEHCEIMQESGVYTPAVPEDGEISVSFIDVGKADATFVTAEGYNVLIDAGVSKDAEEITTFLDRYDIDSLDLVIASHGDADHIGGMTSILNTYEVDKFLMYDVADKYESDTKIYNLMLDTLEENNIDITYAQAGDTFNFGSMVVKVISPDHEYKDSNDDSVVVKITYGETDFLFTGDASQEVEEYLLKTNADLDCEVLKVSHHGSKTATTSEFLEAVDPEIAIVPVGENIYNLPNVEVINRLKNYDDLEMYRSDYHGNITVTSDGKEITVDTEK